MKITAEPRSDQWNADDFIGGPRTFTVAEVVAGTAEQKYDVHLVEGESRSWRPPLTMLRLLIAAWGDEAQLWKGRRVTLFRDERVRFGADTVGGIRVSHMSDLPDGRPFEVRLTSTRGKRTLHHVDPLPDLPATPRDTDDVDTCTDVETLRGWWKSASGERRKAIEARVKVLESAPPASYAETPPTDAELGAMFGGSDE